MTTETDRSAEPLEEFLNSERFDGLLHTYRAWSATDPEGVSRAREAIVQAIRDTTTVIIRWRDSE